MGLQTVLLVVQTMIAVALIAVILIQRSAQDGGGLMGGGNTMGGLFTARGSANVLTRVTAILATLFILNSLGLGYIASAQHQNKSILDEVPAGATTPAPAPSPTDKGTAPSVPTLPEVPLAQ